MDHPAFSRTDHRPWAVPAKKWRWRQSWCDLLFAHWPIPAGRLRPLIPEPLRLQEFDGSAWVGVVPFRMEGVSLRGLPGVAGLSAFPELNVRTYVEAEGKPGVWFFSLDAGNRLAVWAARKLFHLPYFFAEMAVHHSADGIGYQSRRRLKERAASSSHGQPPSSAPAMFLARYRPISAPHEAQAGTLEHWLTERYCLYAQASDGSIRRAEIHHHPWPLQHAEADIAVNSMFEPLGLALPEQPPLLHFARRLDVVVWPPKKL